MRTLVTLLLSALLAASVAAADATLKAGTFDPPRAAPDFTLRGSDGNDLSLRRFRGKVVILFFGYTHCPAVCPTTLGTLASAYKQLGADAKDLQVVYVTVDPDHDDVARMREYLATVNPTFRGATGTPAELEAVRRDFGVSSTKVGEGLFNHASSTFLIDRAGMLRAMMPYGQAPDAYVHDVRLLLGKGGAS